MTQLDLTSLPSILRIEELAALIGKAPTKIRTCATNGKYAHLIPRPFKLPGSRRLCWYRDEVLAWMKRATIVEPAKKAASGRRGSSNKAERIAAQQAGLTVKQWRAQQGLRK